MMRSSHFGHWKLRWISRRWNPTEWPKQSVTKHSAKNTASADQVK